MRMLYLLKGLIAHQIAVMSDFRLRYLIKLQNKRSNPNIEENLRAFRLLSGEMVEDIKLMLERKLFMKGILSQKPNRRVCETPSVRNNSKLFVGSYGIQL